MAQARAGTGNGWVGGYVEHFSGMDVYISVVFSWDVAKAIGTAVQYSQMGLHVHLGGPAIKLAGLQTEEWSALSYHNPNATFTSRGCVNKCGFCAVPKLEGDLIELNNWEPKPIVCDNNLLACSRKHFDRVIDLLKSVPDVDFNQGLAASLLTDYHASRIAELDMKTVRLAWDHVGYESKFMRDWEILRKAGIPKSKITVYCLIGFNDTPDDALYRLSAVRKLGGYPFPMRYQPLDVSVRNGYVSPQWTNDELVRYCRYWANFRYVGGIPFSEFEYPKRRQND